MRQRSGLAAFFSMLLTAAAARAEADPTYTALRAAKPAGAAVAVQDLTLERDVFLFKFVRGSFQFLEPVAGRVTGAVFVGEGTWLLNPAHEVERRHLALLTGTKNLEVLTDRFDSMVLLFTDGTEAEIRAAGKDGGTAPDAGAAWDRARAAQRKDLKSNLQVRILADLLRPADPTRGVFLAAVDGKDLAAGLVLVDPQGLNWFRPQMQPGSENSGLWMMPEFDRGFWYLARRKAEAGAPPLPPVADAKHYVVDSKILDNTRLAGTTTITVQGLAPEVRVIPLQLFDKLRIRQADVAPPEGDTWAPAAFIQEKDEEDSDPAVVLPEGSAANGTCRLRLVYEGKEVLRDMGEGTFAVGARQSWYPNLGTFLDSATYDLTYSVPKGRQVVSVGDRLSDKVEGDAQVSEWKAPTPIRVAGFNYGKFKRIDSDDRDSGMKIEVFSNPGTPDIINEINMALGGRTAISGGAPMDLRSESRWLDAGISRVSVDTATFAKNALADGINSARIYNAYFGPIAEKHVAITQQAQWFFGQSWPSLIFLPYLAALDGTTRRELGLGGSGMTDFVDLVGPHEVAHQWWGHAVGESSYRDVWISEGFAEFSAALVMERTLPPKRLADYWEDSRKRILATPPGNAIPNDAAGPIRLGVRLATRTTPWAYQTLVYLKGAYVLHMLRMLMWDPRGRPPDAQFMAMMKDFVKASEGKNVSTRDFQDAVERHMTPTMDVAKNGKMDWFFRQWVDGTEIPSYDVNVTVQSAGKGEVKLSGSVAQKGVSKDFVGFLPLYLEYDKGEMQRLAVVNFVGEQSVPLGGTIKLPKPPKRIVANARCDVLTR